jgi:hypothetical protein
MQCEITTDEPLSSEAASNTVDMSFVPAIVSIVTDDNPHEISWNLTIGTNDLVYRYEM